MKVTCNCGCMVLVREDRRGSQVRCPQCDAMIRVPLAPMSPPPLPHEQSTANPEPAPPPLPAANTRTPPPLPQSMDAFELPARDDSLADVATLAKALAQVESAAADESAANGELPASGTDPLATKDGASSADGSMADGDAPTKPSPPPLPTELPGIEPSIEGRRSSLHLAIALAMIGLFSAAPAILHIVQNSPLATLTAMALPRWVAFLLLVSGLHLVYAVYVAQLPDWSTVWVVAITMLAAATLESVLLAATLLGSQQSGVVKVFQLQEHLRGGRAAGWCFIMLCLSATTAYGAGRLASRWRALESARLQSLHVAD